MDLSTFELLATASLEFTAFAPPYGRDVLHHPFPNRSPARPDGLFYRLDRVASQVFVSAGAG